MVIGWAICSFGLLLLYVIAAGKVDGVMGIVMFTLGYLLYDAGHTIPGRGSRNDGCGYNQRPDSAAHDDGHRSGILPRCAADPDESGYPGHPAEV